jgi:hypothetical protein
MLIKLTDSTPHTVNIFNLHSVNVVVAPDAGSTITVEYSLSSLEEIRAGSARFYAWGPGPVKGAAVEAVFDATISAMRVTAIAGTGTVEYINLGGA